MCRADDVCYSSSRVVDLDEVEAEMPMMMIETDFDAQLVETKTLNQLKILPCKQRLTVYDPIVLLSSAAKSPLSKIDRGSIFVNWLRMA